MNRLPVASVIALQVLAFATAHAQWSPDYSISQRVGLYGAAQTGSSGLQISTAMLFNPPAFVVGNSNRITGVNVNNGYNVWAWDGTTTTQIGLTGSDNTGSAGYQVSIPLFQNATGKVVGISNRFYDITSDNGQSAWVWNGTATSQIGLTAAANTGSAGRQFSEPRFQNVAGQVAGHSLRFSGVNTDNGRDAWVWNGTTTVQIGLTGGVYTGSAGYQFSFVRFQNEDGHVVGYSNHYTGLNTINGVDAWVWDGVNTIQIGLTGAAYIGSAGYHYSFLQLQNDSGQVIGHSNRYTGINTDNGQDAWVWNDGATTQIGLTAAANTGSAGYRFSDPLYQNNAGVVAGYSNRYTGVNSNNGRDAWVWNGTTTSQVGLTGGSYTGSFGYQYSSPQFLNEGGEVVGISSRYTYTGINTANGGDTWVWNGTSTTQIGLTGGVYTGSAGYQFSAPWFQNAGGQVAGYSNRYTGTNTANGRNAWVWNGTTTTKIGLTAAANTGSAGYQYSNLVSQNDIGQIAGYSNRYTGVNTINGQDAWVWNGTTSVQVGLIGGANTGSAGYQSSTPQFQNNLGQVVGTSKRYSGVNTENGQDGWYFDAATGICSPMIGSIRTSDNYAFSSPTSLTEDGFVLGSYTYFAGGLGNGEQRAFAFRPDCGFTDLGELVNGGLAANGWSTLLAPQISDGLSTIIGSGLALGQSAGRSVFVMNLNPHLCDADFNHDDIVDFFDYLDFVAAFSSGSASADFNNDSVIDFFDYLDFVQAFSAGC